MDRYYIDYSLKNGLGHPAISLYLTGCDKPVKCKDCHNWELQEQSYYDYSIKNIKYNINKNIQNYLQFHKNLYVAILGGEPLAKYNRNITLQISKFIKQQYNNSKIILYSWRTLKQIQEERLEIYIKYIDYGVLGAYDNTLHTDNILPASTNQYIYDFNNKVKLKPIILKKG